MKIIGHRGMGKEFPENTMLAFKKASELGLQAVELDVRLSKDQELIVFHDPTLERLCSQSGQIKDLTLEEISNLKVFGERPIPRLEEALEFLLSKDIEVWIEIKVPGCIPGLAQAIKGHPKSSLIKIIAFDHRELIDWNDICPEVETGCLLYGLPLHPEKCAIDSRASTIGLHHQFLSDKIVQQIKGHGLSLSAWTLENMSSFSRLKNWDIDFLTVDNPSDYADLLS